MRAGAWIAPGPTPGLAAGCIPGTIALGYASGECGTPWQLRKHCPARLPSERYSNRPVTGSGVTTDVSKLISLLLVIGLPWAELMPCAS